MPQYLALRRIDCGDYGWFEPGDLLPREFTDTWGHTAAYHLINQNRISIAADPHLHTARDGAPAAPPTPPSPEQLKSSLRAESEERQTRAALVKAAAKPEE